MTKRNPFQPRREIDREPAMPTAGDWIGGIALFAGLFAAAFIGWGIS